MGIFVSVFAVKHVFIVTKGLTTKQLQSIKFFETETIKQNMKIEGFEIVKDQVKNFGEVQINFENTMNNNNKDKSIFIDSNNNNQNLDLFGGQNKLFGKLTLKDRFLNLWKFYRKSIPDSIV